MKLSIKTLGKEIKLVGDEKFQFEDRDTSKMFTFSEKFGLLKLKFRPAKQKYRHFIRILLYSF